MWLERSNAKICAICDIARNSRALVPGFSGKTANTRTNRESTRLRLLQAMTVVRFWRAYIVAIRDCVWSMERNRSSGTGFE